MDRDEFNAVLENTGVTIWSLIEKAVSVAAEDHWDELKARRDGIVEKLFTPPPAPPSDRWRHSGVESDGGVPMEKKGSSSPIAMMTPQSVPKDDVDDVEDDDVAEEEEEEEKKRVLEIKERLDDHDQPEDAIVGLLQSLADMDITFKALKETDIGRHVNGLRKHPSNEVRRLVKQLVRKWKEIVDDWVKANSATDNASPAIITDGDSPQPIPAKSHQNSNQVPDFAYSPNPHNGHSERNGVEAVETKARPVQRREAPLKAPSSATPAVNIAKVKEQKDSLMDPERLASARKRLQSNYQEAQNAKKNRTIQVMDIHEIPKPKNSFIARNNKGGYQAKHW